MPLDIESRLDELIQETAKPKRCTSTGFKIATIAAFSLVLVCAVGAFFLWSRSENIKLDKEHMEIQKNENKEKLVQLEQEQKSLKELLEQTNHQITDIKDQQNKTRTDINSMHTKIEIINTNITDYSKMLETATKERDDAKSINTRLSEEDSTLTRKKNILVYEKEEIDIWLKKNRTELNKWKIISGAGLIIGIIDSFAEIRAHTVLTQKKIDLIITEKAHHAFNLLTPQFEEYNFLTQQTGAHVLRETCFHNSHKNDLKNCTNLEPTLTTIMTNQGFVFSIFMNIAWRVDPGEYSDANMMAFSINNAKSASIKDTYKDKAFVVNSESLINFGHGSLVIAADGRNGTARGDAFNIPTPLHNENFFLNGTVEFEVLDLKIERLIRYI